MILSTFKLSETGSNVKLCANFLKHAHFSNNSLSLKQSDMGYFLFLLDKNGQALYEPRHEKTCLRGLRQLRLKPACSATEAS